MRAWFATWINKGPTPHESVGENMRRRLTVLSSGDWALAAAAVTATMAATMRQVVDRPVARFMSIPPHNNGCKYTNPPTPDRRCGNIAVGVRFRAPRRRVATLSWGACQCWFVPPDQRSRREALEWFGCSEFHPKLAAHAPARRMRMVAGEAGYEQTRVRVLEVTMTGTIRTLRVDKGFGFIKDDAGKDYFFHQSAVYGEGLDNLREGDSVEFDVGEGPKGPRAENVRRTST
jgi:CspA family cold shock protein